MASSLDKGIRLHQEKLAEAYRHREGELEKWRGFLHEYEALERRLVTLPDKTKHDIMVPLGPLAFMSGQIVHTNEILVLLGDNIFAERSAKQAVGIIKRRQEFVKGNIDAVEKLLNDLGTRAEYSQEEVWGGAKDEEGNDIVEINEPATEEEERAWQQRNVYKAWDSEKTNKENNKKSEIKVRKETEEEKAQFKAFMESLEKLERLEREQAVGMELEGEEEEAEEEEETEESEDHEEEEEEEDEEEEEEDLEDVKVEVEEVEHIDVGQERDMTKETETSAKDVITTGPTLSKFKQQREQQRAEAQRKQEEERYRVPEKPAAAFTGGVVERDVVKDEGGRSVHVVPKETQKSAPERVSRFKAAMRGAQH